jgi:O-methyltransferase
MKKKLLFLMGLFSAPQHFLTYRMMREYTMITSYLYMKNLALAARFKNVKGAIVECGTWRGGMIAGIARTLGNDRQYFLYDSFEGLPPAREIDGVTAMEWQADKTSKKYYDNCKAEMSFAESAMKLSGASHYQIHKGWFNDTLPGYESKNIIAVLRLDGDWYDSTMECLNNLYRYVVPGGLIIIDDYHTWDGCTRAVHDFISKNNLPVRICQYDNTLCYWVKQE